MQHSVCLRWKKLLSPIEWWFASLFHFISFHFHNIGSRNGSHFFLKNSIWLVSLVKTQSNKHLLNEQFKWQSHRLIIRTVQLFVGCRLCIHRLTELQAPKVPTNTWMVLCVCIVFFERWIQATRLWQFENLYRGSEQKCYRWCKTKFLWKRFVELNQSMPFHFIFYQPCHARPFHSSSIAVTLLFKRMV